MMRFRSPLFPFLSIVALVLFGSAGGPDVGWDAGPVQWLALTRHAHPEFQRAAEVLTYMGSGYVVVPVVLAAALFLALNRDWAKTFLLVGAVLMERAAMIILKATVQRPRPTFDMHTVPVDGFSFPSGHSANSVTAYILLALLLSPPRYQRTAVEFALGLCLLIGAPRPILGVHWPSDVLAGWSLALLVIWFSISIAERAGITAVGTEA